MVRFHHSGKLGDIIYGLAAMRACGRATLFLNTDGRYGFGPEQAASLMPLLNAQPYLQVVKQYSGETFDYDLDRFRTEWTTTENLGDRQLKLVGLSSRWRDEAWLSVESQTVESSGCVIFARSVTHRGVPEFWQTCYELFGRDALFVGSLEEHAAFCSEVGPVAYHPTRDLLQLAKLVKQSVLVVANQSCPYAIAEGLKVRTIQETCSWAPNCVFERPTALYVREEGDLAALAGFADCR